MDSHMFKGQSPAVTMPELDAAADHSYPTRYATASGNPGDGQSPLASPTKANKKLVTFELQFEGAPEIRGRLPLRVGISAHDSTESIISVVKNFYGIYDHTIQGISFEDKESGVMLIPRFENFEHDMHVAVRILPGSPSPTTGPQQAWNGEAGAPAMQMPAHEAPAPAMPAHTSQILHQPPSRPSSRLAARKLSASPQLGSVSAVPRNRSRPTGKVAKTSFEEGLEELNDAHNGYSSGDGGPGSVASSRLGATADISVENIVEGGRRHYAKFDSSELPLFVPPQVPAPNSISSISPQRRSNGNENVSPYDRPSQRNITYNLPLPSPLSYTFEQPPAGSPANGGFQIPAVPKHGRSLRDRTSGASVATSRSSLGLGGGRRMTGGILPTPDPTIASTISDEDVALQLMRLSDVSNFSHGRTSTSAMDDAFSGRAEAASSSSSSSDEEVEEQPLPTIHPSTEVAKGKRKQNHVHELPSYDSIEHTADEGDGDYEAGAVKSEFDEDDGFPRAKIAKTKATARARSGPAKPRVPKPYKARTGSTSTVATAIAASNGRKASTASTLTFAHQPGADEDDLSTKPRCQRCRKSKKGCDRQRPCGRCRDAGIGIEGCISEDEGNGRKGRYGRHMGVPVKKAHLLTGSVASSASPIEGPHTPGPFSPLLDQQDGAKPFNPMPIDMQDANKKRKRP